MVTMTLCWVVTARAMIVLPLLVQVLAHGAHQEDRDDVGEDDRDDAAGRGAADVAAQEPIL